MLDPFFFFNFILFVWSEAILSTFAGSYVSGYKNRFQNFIKNLREIGDEVHLADLFLFSLIISVFLLILSSKGKFSDKILNFVKAILAP